VPRKKQQPKSDDHEKDLIVDTGFSSSVITDRTLSMRTSRTDYCDQTGPINQMRVMNIELGH